MVKRSSGMRVKTRNKLKDGRFSIAEALQEFKIDEKVIITINPAVHKGMPHPRFQGKFATVLEKRGRAFVIEIKDGNKAKQLIAKPEHLSRNERTSQEGLKKN